MGTTPLSGPTDHPADYPAGVRSRQTALLAGLTAATVLVATGCSEGENTGGPYSVVELEPLLITLEDFPSGWEERPIGTDGEDPAAELGACIPDDLASAADDLAESTDGPGVVSNEFAPDGSDDLSASHAITPLDPGLAEDVIDLFGTEEYATCYEGVLQDSFGAVAADVEGYVVGDVSITIGEADIADGSVRYIVDIPAEVDGEPFDLHVDLWLLRRADVVSSLSFVGVGEPFPADLSGSLVGIAANRLSSLDAG